MWLDEVGEVVEMFRGSFPLSFLFFVPILILLSPVGPASAAHDFAVYRMQHYDLQGSSYGCRNSLVNVEARPVDASVYTRRCVIAKLRELTLEKYREMMQQNAGALLVLLPQNLTALSSEDAEHLQELEQELHHEETQMPVYFTPESYELLDIYEQVKTAVNSDKAGSAAEAMLSAANANGFQMVVGGSQAKALSDFQLTNIQGKLTGYGIEEQLPTIALVAHYDAYAIAPALAKGADSNGSGVVALLELARLFSKLFTNSRTHAKYNLVFLLSAGGKFNYQGTKRWIEDQLDSAEGSLLLDVSYVLCMDSLGGSRTLNLHVSKPPREGSAGDVFFKHLEWAGQEQRVPFEVSMKHKKINLADDYLAWEHERFSIRRLPAFTLSSHDSHKPGARHSMLDTRENVQVSVLAKNIRVLAESLARQVFNLSQEGAVEIFTEGLQVEESLVEAWLDHLSGQSRAAQLMDKTNPLVNTLEQAFIKHLKEVQRHSFRADKRDPEFVFYSGAEYTMNAYNVKPAVFDLFLAVGIAAYLAVLYLVMQNIGTLYLLFRKISRPIKSKAQ